MQDLDSLHQRASSEYLQGNVEAALETWKSVLELAPDDERAIEGVRVCTHMIEAQQDAEFSDEAGEAAVAAAAAPPGGSDFPELEDKLDFGGAGKAAPGMDLAWSLGEDGEVDQPPAPAPDAEAPTAAASPGWGWNVGEGDDEGPAAEEPDAVPPPAEPDAIGPAPSSAATSELELRRRANELLANALVAMEAGNEDEALRTLDRVLILDESNEAAAALKERIGAARRAQPAGSPRVEHAAPAGGALEVEGEDDRELDRPPGGHVDPASSGAKEMEPDLGDERPLELAPIDLDVNAAAAHTPLPVTELPPDDEPSAQDAGWDEAEGADAADPDLAQTEVPAARAAGPRRWAAIGGVALLVAAGAWYFLGRGDDSPPVDEAAVAAESVDTALSGGKKPPRGNAGAGPAAGSAATAPAGAGPSEPAHRDVAALLARADAAFAAGDYKEAIVDYNAVLKEQPDNDDVLAKFEKAGDLYRKERERVEKWEHARSAFRDGNYQEALRLFYRLDATEDPQRVQRYKVNGWYNLGVMALRAGDCKTARSNFKDARDVQGNDSGLLGVMQLARSCPTGTELRQQVAAIELRDLED